MFRPSTTSEKLRLRPALVAVGAALVLLALSPSTSHAQTPGGGKASPKPRPEIPEWKTPKFPCRTTSETYHSYPVCKNKEWHIITDVYYTCENRTAGVLKAVHDINTHEECDPNNPNKTKPLVIPAAPGMTMGTAGCQGKKYEGEHITAQCLPAPATGKRVWYYIKYPKYSCANGTTCLGEPPRYEMTDIECEKPLPPYGTVQSFAVGPPPREGGDPPPPSDPGIPFDPRRDKGKTDGDLPLFPRSSQSQLPQFEFHQGGTADVASGSATSLEFAGRDSAIDALFQNMMIEGGEIDLVDAARAGDGPFAGARPGSARSLGSLFASFFQRAGSNGFAHRQAAVRWVDRTPALQRASGSKGTTALPGLLVSLVATGDSSGNAFQLQVLNRSGIAGRLTAPDGLVLEPVKQLASKALAGSGVPTNFNLSAYCLNFAKLPPKAGALYRIADDAAQRQFKPIRGVLQAARQLTSAGELHPDSAPESYASFVKQWAVWTKLEGWDQRKFGEQFLDRTKKNVEGIGQPWTKQLEQAVRSAIPNRWRDIVSVLDQARSLEAPAAR